MSNQTQHRQTQPTEQRLRDGLLLRSVRHEQDIDRFAAFNTLINGADQGLTCAQLLRHHPTIRYDDFLLVEDPATGQVLSTTCLIPWRWRWGEITLDVAMLEMVATHPEHRQRGLVRAQIERFHTAVSEQGFELSVIEGIPFYYRQFGYAYAVDHWPYDVLPGTPIPDAGQAGFTLRPATMTDLPVLQRLYATTMGELDLYTERSSDYWHFLLAAAQTPIQLVVEVATQNVVGYLSVWPLARRSGLHIAESGFFTVATAQTVLGQLKANSAGEVQIGGPLTSPMLRAARSLGSRPGLSDQWLLRITDVRAFLSKLAPLLAQRLARSPYVGLTSDLRLNLFRRAFVLRFVGGQLQTVIDCGFVDASMGADGGDLCIPPDAFVRLIMGYRTLDELRDAWPDIVIRADRRSVLDVLFPPVRAYFCLPYLYRGPLDYTEALHGGSFFELLKMNLRGNR